VAYIRFASVYRSFADIESFESALKELKWSRSGLNLGNCNTPIFLFLKTISIARLFCIL
jgi:hypothetical protein